ncbi:hypothetical protein ACJX0J_035125, partial [Zea mays]
LMNILATKNMFKILIERLRGQHFKMNGPFYILFANAGIPNIKLLIAILVTISMKIVTLILDKLVWHYVRLTMISNKTIKPIFHATLDFMHPYWYFEYGYNIAHFFNASMPHLGLVGK